MTKDFYCREWRKYVPDPVCDAHPEYSELYERAWELARDHVRSIDGMPQTPYMDEAFCDTQVWIWDTCFMTLFCKYAQNVFPGIETLKNFYEVLHNGGHLAKINVPDGEPEWTGNKPGETAEIKICISDNPPLFAWAEYENALFHGDIDYVKDLLYNRRVLQKHYEWVENLREFRFFPGVRSQSRLINCDIGYKWEGGRSGMDNTPRGRVGEKADGDRPNNPNMLWIDAICQQALSAKMIAELAEKIGDTELRDEWAEKYTEKKEIVNKYYWDENDGFYYDIDCNTHEFYKVMTIASYWTLISGIASDGRAEEMVKRLCDPALFNGEVPLISLSKSDADYIADGRYWRGSLWLPTAYATVKGLDGYGYFKEAREASVKVIEHMLRTYNQYVPHTIWECYSPEYAAPGRDAHDSEFARPDFCGWSALGPISMYIEYVLGFHKVDAFEKRVEWIHPDDSKGKVGIKNLRFGDVVTDIVSENGSCRVTSNAPYTLVINGREHQISAGENIITLL